MTIRNPSRNPAFAILVAGIAVVGMGTPRALAAGQTVPPGQVTFTKHVAPILQRSCQNCHRPGGGAPMSFITYEDVRPWARSIKTRTGLRDKPDAMPPWFIEKNIGLQKFKDDPSLSDEEIATIARWVDSGAHQGNPADMPPPRQFAKAGTWSIGTPDLIVSSEVVTVKPRAPDWHGTLKPIPTGLTEDRYVKAVEFMEVRLQEGTSGQAAATAADLNYFLLHHADVSSDPLESSAAVPEDPVDSETAQSPEYTVKAAPFRVVYELGQNAMVSPDDAAQRLAAGSVLYYGVHLHSVGREVPIRVDIAFKFHPKGYTPKYNGSRLVTMGGGSTGEDLLDIPAGQDNVRFDSFYTMPQPGRMMTYEPHMHASGKRFCLEAIYPTGVREMLNCSGYNHNWVKTYVYDDDVAPLLPKGTILRLIGWYDNSAGNRRNVDPRNWKGWGNITIEDMFLHLPQMIFLSEDQFNEQVAARKANQRLNTTATGGQPR
jgi:mono/diheme cytochrome c family protein